MTSAYSFSAPIATILPSPPIAPASEAEQPASRPAARLATSGTTAAFPLQPPGMTRPLSGLAAPHTGNDNDSQFRSQIGMKPGPRRVAPDGARRDPERALGGTGSEVVPCELWECHRRRRPHGPRGPGGPQSMGWPGKPPAPGTP